MGGGLREGLMLPGALLAATGERELHGGLVLRLQRFLNAVGVGGHQGPEPGIAELDRNGHVIGMATRLDAQRPFTVGQFHFQHLSVKMLANAFGKSHGHLEPGGRANHPRQGRGLR